MPGGIFWDPAEDHLGAHPKVLKTLARVHKVHMVPQCAQLRCCTRRLTI